MKIEKFAIISTLITMFVVGIILAFAGAFNMWTGILTGILGTSVLSMESLTKLLLYSGISLYCFSLICFVIYFSKVIIMAINKAIKKNYKNKYTIKEDPAQYRNTEVNEKMHKEDKEDVSH